MDRRAFLSIAAASAVAGASSPPARAQNTGDFASAISYSTQRGGATLLIARHGIIRAEHYAGVRHDERLVIGAGAKPLAALLAATLAENRLMTLDEPVAFTLGDWGAHPVKSTISIRSLLSGASGIAFGPERQGGLSEALALEPTDPPGVRFQDDAAPYILFEEIVRRKLTAAGREPDPARYLTERTLEPIGCVPVGWARESSGAARFDDGVQVSARGWAQIGELIRRGGVWRGQQLASSNVLQEVLRGSFAETRAGFGFWLAAPGRAETPTEDIDIWRARSPAPADTALAAGAGGQRLYIIPSLGTVIVRQSRSTRARAPWSDADFLSLVLTAL